MFVYQLINYAIIIIINEDNYASIGLTCLAVWGKVPNTDLSQIYQASYVSCVGQKHNIWLNIITGKTQRKPL